MSAKETESTTAPAKAVVAGKKKKGNLMYLGPTITGAVRHSTVFKNGILPQKVSDCVEQFPAMKKLFVPMEDVPKAVKELKKEQSVLKAIYSQTALRFK